LTELYVSLATVGVLLLLLGVLVGLLKDGMPVSEPFIALLADVLIGPADLRVFDLAGLGNQTVILGEAALVTLGVALVGPEGARPQLPSMSRQEASLIHPNYC
jgi:NhaP-type Na+/H+ or K+/H+ antiporter